MKAKEIAYPPLFGKWFLYHSDKGAEWYVKVCEEGEKGLKGYTFKKVGPNKYEHQYGQEASPVHSLDDFFEGVLIEDENLIEELTVQEAKALLSGRET